MMSAFGADFRRLGDTRPDFLGVAMIRSRKTRMSSTIEAYAILDTPAEAPFDELARAAAQVVGAPLALIAFADGNRLWFKARVGVESTETMRAESLCAHAMDTGNFFVVSDAVGRLTIRHSPVRRGTALHPLLRRRTAGDHRRTGSRNDLRDRPHATRPERRPARRLARAGAAGRWRSSISTASKARPSPSSSAPKNCCTRITEGTAAVTGTDVLRVARAASGDAPCRSVGSMWPSVSTTTARGRALLWMGNDLQPNFEYNVANTPCMKVTQGETCLYTQNVQEYFPTNQFLKNFGAQSYLGVPLWSSSVPPRHWPHGPRRRQANVRGSALGVCPADICGARRRRARARAGRGEAARSARRSREPEEPAAGRERVPAGGNPQRAQFRGNGRTESGAAGPPAEGRARGRHRCDRSDFRRNGIGQRAHRPRASQQRTPQAPAARQGELRRRSGFPARERAIRSRQRRLYRRDRPARRPIRAGRWRHVVSRRDRRAAARYAGQAAARPPGAGVRAGRQQQDDARGRSHHRGDQPRSRPRKCGPADSARTCSSA